MALTMGSLDQLGFWVKSWLVTYTLVTELRKHWEFCCTLLLMSLVFGVLAHLR